MQKICTFCKAALVPIKTTENELICKNCGLIIEEQLEYADAPDITEASSKMALESNSYSSDYDTETLGLPKENTGTIKSSQNLNLGLATTMRVEDKKMYRSGRLSKALKKTSLRAHTNSTKEKNSFKAYNEITRLSKTLEISQKICQKVLSTYHDFNERGLLKNRNVNSCILSLLVLECNKNNIPLSISEALKESGVSRRKFNHDYYRLLYMFENFVPSSANIQSYLDKIGSEIEDAPLKDKYLETMEKLKKEGIFDFVEGREAIVIVGSISYYLLKYLGYQRLEKFLKTLVLNKLTLRNKWQRLILQHDCLKKYEVKGVQ